MRSRPFDASLQRARLFFAFLPRMPRSRGLIADGMSNRDIAERLSLSVRTVETHRERIMDKLDIRTVAGLTKFALAEGLTHLD